MDRPLLYSLTIANGLDRNMPQGLPGPAVVIKDACGFDNRDAAERSMASLEFADEAFLTNVESICAQFRHIQSQQAVRT